MILYDYLFREEINRKYILFYFEFIAKITFIAYQRTEVLLAIETSKLYTKKMFCYRRAYLSHVTRVRAGSNPAEAVRFFGLPENPQYAFLRRGSKIICPMSQLCGM